MFCPQCGTKKLRGTQRFCQECGAEVGQETGQGAREAADRAPRASSLPRRVLSNRMMKKDQTMKTLLMVAGLVILLPLAMHLLFGILLASLVAGVALIAIGLKLAPVLALGLVLYWIVTRHRRTLRSER
jgi:uncharacterized membrane protein YvbJ